MMDKDWRRKLQNFNSKSTTDKPARQPMYVKILNKKVPYSVLAIIAVAIILVFTISCGSCDYCGNNDNDYSGETNMIAKSTKNGVQFTTENTVEEYCNGRFIVSKLDGSLFGLLDMKGDEILPLVYDKLHLIERRNKCYIHAEYEGKKGIFDLNGNEIIPLQYDEVVDFNSEITRTYAYNADSYVYDIYDSNGNLLTSLDFNSAHEINFLGDNYLIVGAIDEYNQCLESSYTIMDYQGDIVVQEEVGENYIRSGVTSIIRDNSIVVINNLNPTVGGQLSVVIDENLNSYIVNISKEDFQEGKRFEPVSISPEIFDGYYYAMTYYNYFGDKTIKHSVIDAETGKSIKEIEATIDSDNFRINIYAEDYSNNLYLLDSTGNLTPIISEQMARTFFLEDKILYASNDTWKLIDMDGNSVGDNRYFECGTVSSNDFGVDFYYLMNADGECCVYSPNGRMVMPYGTLTILDDSLYLNGEYVANSVCAYDAVCFITEDENGNSVVNWYGKTAQA